MTRWPANSWNYFRQPRSIFNIKSVLFSDLWKFADDLHPKIDKGLNSAIQTRLFTRCGISNGRGNFVRLETATSNAQNKVASVVTYMLLPDGDLMLLEAICLKCIDFAIGITKLIGF